MRGKACVLFRGHDAWTRNDIRDLGFPTFAIFKLMLQLRSSIYTLSVKFGTQNYYLHFPYR